MGTGWPDTRERGNGSHEPSAREHSGPSGSIPWPGAMPRLTGDFCIRSMNGAPGATRTPDPRLRRPLLYPTELQARRRMRMTQGVVDDYPYLALPVLARTFLRATAPPLVVPAVRAGPRRRASAPRPWGRDEERAEGRLMPAPCHRWVVDAWSNRRTRAVLAPSVSPSGNVGGWEWQAAEVGTGAGRMCEGAGRPSSPFNRVTWSGSLPRRSPASTLEEFYLFLRRITRAAPISPMPSRARGAAAGTGTTVLTNQSLPVAFGPTIA